MAKGHIYLCLTGFHHLHQFYTVGLQCLIFDRYNNQKITKEYFQSCGFKIQNPVLNKNEKRKLNVPDFQKVGQPS